MPVPYQYELREPTNRAHRDDHVVLWRIGYGAIKTYQKVQIPEIAKAMNLWLVKQARGA